MQGARGGGASDFGVWSVVPGGLEQPFSYLCGDIPKDATLKVLSAWCLHAKCVQNTNSNRRKICNDFIFVPSRWRIIWGYPFQDGCRCIFLCLCGCVLMCMWPLVDVFKKSPILWVHFDTRHLWVVGRHTNHYADKCCLAWQWISPLLLMVTHTHKFNTK